MSALEPESGIWYGFCWAVLVTRLISRRLHSGSWRHLNSDDYLICLAMMTMTTLMGAMHIVVHASSNLLAPQEDISRFTPDEIQQRIFGSKIVLVVEQMQCCTIWLVKACLLLIYTRMTALLPHYKIVLIVAGYTALSFIVMEILYFGVWCRPFSQYFAVPPSNPQCSAATNHLITNAILNISTDLLIIAIPMPLLFKVKLPATNKAVLIGLFLIGVFNIVAAALNKYYSFSHPFGDEWPRWYLREAYTAFLCANLPLTYPLIQRVFNLRSWSHNSYDGHYYSGSVRRTMRSGKRSQRKSTNGLRIARGGISKTVSVNVTKSRSVHDVQRSESEERIYGPPTSRIFETNSFVEAGESESHLWAPGCSTAIEMGPVSPSSQKEGSVMTGGSIKSLENAVIKN